MTVAQTKQGKSIYSKISQLLQYCVQLSFYGYLSQRKLFPDAKTTYGMLVCAKTNPQEPKKPLLFTVFVELEGFYKRIVKRYLHHRVNALEELNRRARKWRGPFPTQVQ
jgi:hypothetical protein